MLSREHWKRPARPAAGALLLSVCKATAISAQHGRRGKEGEQEGEGDCALHVCSYPTTRQGLTAIMPIERPGGDIRTSRKEGVEREWRGSGGKLVNTELKRAKHIS